MADNEDYDYDDLDNNEANLVKDLRRQIKALSKDKSELSQELTAFKQGARERSIAEVLEAKGVNPKVAKFIPTDIEGEDSVATWLAENAEIFGFTVGTENTEAQPSSEELSSAKRLRALNEVASTPNRADDIAAQIANAKSDEEVNAIFAEAKKYFL